MVRLLFRGFSFFQLLKAEVKTATLTPNSQVTVLPCDSMYI